MLRRYEYHQLNRVGLWDNVEFLKISLLQAGTCRENCVRLAWLAGSLPAEASNRQTILAAKHQAILRLGDLGAY